MFYIAVGQECPECKRHEVFPNSRIIKIDNMLYGALTVKCHGCNWEPSEEEITKRVKETLMGEMLDDNSD